MLKVIQTSFLFLVCCFGNINAQNLITNGGFEGTLPSIIQPQPMPAGWTNVPHTDFVCNANVALSCTPDITAATGFPSCTPFLGSYSMTGLVALHTPANGGNRYHEGVQQTLSGLVISRNYEITFNQTVAPQANALDPTGMWDVFVDNTLVGTTAPTTVSGAANWELRTVSFTATSSSHTIKFMPRDDDANDILDFGDATGAVRMAIDDVIIIETTTLPIRLSTFEAAYNKNQVDLNWATNEEINNDYFIVERSADGITWTGILETRAKGNSNSLETYALIDENPLHGQSYYRLVQVDFDKTRTYSKIVAVASNEQFTARVYPNPVSDILTVELEKATIATKTTITLTNVLGQGFPVEEERIGNRIRFSTANLPAGIYHLVLVQGNISKQYSIRVL